MSVPFVISTWCLIFWGGKEGLKVEEKKEEEEEKKEEEKEEDEEKEGEWHPVD